MGKIIAIANQGRRWKNHNNYKPLAASLAALEFKRSSLMLIRRQMHHVWFGFNPVENSIYECMVSGIEALTTLY
jgi:hypothetical protein